MKRHRNPRPRLPKRPSPDNPGPGAPTAASTGTPTVDVAGALDLLREIIGRTDALVGAAEDLLEQEPWGDDDAGDGRRAERLAHLLGAAREAARAAVTAGGQMAAGLARHRAVGA